MKRKVIQIADSTQLVSLPRKWAKKFNIKKGDELDVEEKGSSIVVSTEGNTKVESTELTFTDAQSFLRRNVEMLYKLGYDEINVKFSDPQVIELLQSCVNDLLGFEIVNQGAQHCLVKNIASGLEMEFDNILRRIFLMIISAMKENHAALKDGDYKTLKKIDHFDKTVNKFTNFCERLLNKQGLKDYKRITFVYYTVCQLETLADEYKDMFNYVTEKELKVSNNFMNTYKGTRELFELFYKVFYTPNLKDLLEMKQKRMKLQKDIVKIMEGKNRKEAVAAKHFNTVIIIIQHLATRIFISSS